MNPDVIRLEKSLQFSVKHLLVLIASWPIAYAVSPFLTVQVVRVTYHDDATRSLVRNACITAQNYASWKNDDKFPTLTTLIDSGIWSEPMAWRDSWGRQMKVVTDETGQIKSMKGQPMFYSTGHDGTSATDGNDPDDINSWDDHHYRFYNARINGFERRKYLWRTVWATPVVFGILWCILTIASKQKAGNAG